MNQPSTFKTPEGEKAYLKAYETAMDLWSVPYEEIMVPTRFGMTHIVTCGPKDAPPLVLLHGYFGSLTMWSPNIADFSQDYRVYALDVIGQPSKSIPDEPIREAADFSAWMNATLKELNLDRISLVGLSYGGWLALNFTMNVPEKVEKLTLLSPAACFQPNPLQLNLRGMLMGIFPSRLTLNSLMGWMGFEDTPDDKVTRSMLDLAYHGMKHFRFPPDTAQIMPTVFSDEELRALHVPVLLLIGENDVIYDTKKAFTRASRLIPNFEGELVPGCGHDMFINQYRLVDARVLDFLNDN